MKTFLTILLIYSSIFAQVLEDLNGDGTVSVVTFGDSITAGVGDSQGLGGYPKRLGNYLGVPVSNRGISGERLITDGRARFPSVMLSSTADVVIILEGANDAVFKESSSDYQRALQRVINVATALGKKVVLGAPQRPCCNKGARGPFTDAYAGVVRKLSIINEAPLADFDLAWRTTCKNKNECELYVLPEGLHPNRTGYDVMAQVVAASLLDIDIFAPNGAAELEGALNLPKGTVIVKGES